MNPEAARFELARIVEDCARDGGTKNRNPAAHAFLIRYGKTVLGLASSSGLSFKDILRIAAEKSPGGGIREFALLLVHAIGIMGPELARGETERLLQSFLERALLNPLRRAGYPFRGSPYEKRLALLVLHATIDDHLQPFEPSIPGWIHGSGPDRQA